MLKEPDMVDRVQRIGSGENLDDGVSHNAARLENRPVIEKEIDRRLLIRSHCVEKWHLKM